MNGVTLTHASPRQPVLEYLLATYSAAENFAYFGTDICPVGHIHIPRLFFLNSEVVHLQIPDPNSTFTLEGRCIANPGSVGQPRDRDARAASPSSMIRPMVGNTIVSNTYRRRAAAHALRQPARAPYQRVKRGLVNICHEAPRYFYCSISHSGLLNL